MPKNQQLTVRTLRLDLSNYRVLPQKDEASAIQSLVALDPDKFWAVCRSLQEDGYLPTENIVVLKVGNRHVVKEGNRRIAAMKLLLGYVRCPDVELPSDLTTLPVGWKTSHRAVPCAVYSNDEAEIVDRIVALTHGKAQTAGRLKWNAVARARYARDELGASEPALDLLEKYLKHGKTVSEEQRERWGGDYPLSILDDVMKRLASRCGVTTQKELSESYPRGISCRPNLEKVLSEIGLGNLGFPVIRGVPEFGKAIYGFPALKTDGRESRKGGRNAGKSAPKKKKPVPRTTPKEKAFSTTDSRSVIQVLKKFTPAGNNREKVVALLNEARKLRLTDHPISFCFVLRSMFELSAKAYCKDHRIRTTKRNGWDKDLVVLLRESCNHLTKDETDRALVKQLHGAMTDLGNKKGLLSITSMNQLVHNPHFSLHESHICTVFGNIFPLLEALNK
jgi:hypothetical protein